MQSEASRAELTHPQPALRRFGWVSMSRASLSALVLVACADREPSPSPIVEVNVPAGGSQSSNTSGMGGAAGEATVDSGWTDPPRVGPPAPTDGSMPAMPDAALDGGIGSDDDDAGPWVPPDPTCVDGAWLLAPGFLVARRVDYVADRDSLLVDGGFSTDEPRTLSSAGMPCATATDRAKCEAALHQPISFGRHLVTTAGDNVRLWQGSATRTLLGLLDTPAEAMWWLMANGPYRAPCTVKVYPSDGGYTFENVEPIPGCFTPPDLPAPTYTVTLNSADGALHELAAADGGRSLCGIP